MKRLFAALLLVVTSSAIFAGAVHKAKSAVAQPLVYNWDSGMKGCGLRLIVITDVPSQLHVLDVSLNIFKKAQDYWGSVKGGLGRLAQLTDKKVSLDPVALDSINFLFGNGDRVAHDPYQNTSTPIGHLIAGSDPIQTSNFLLNILENTEVMLAVKTTAESTDRVFRFKAVFDEGDADTFRKCIGGLVG